MPAIDPSLLLANNWVQLVSLLAGLIGTVAGFVFYFRGKTVRRPCLASESLQLVTKRHRGFSDLGITYRGQSVEQVTVTHVYFWNEGRETIRGSDLAAALSFGVKFPKECRVLATELVSTTDAACGFVLQLPEPLLDGGTLLPFTFDYLDFKDGAAVRVIHDGTMDLTPTPYGKVMGAPIVQTLVPARSEYHEGETVLPRRSFLVLFILLPTVGMTVYAQWLASPRAENVLMGWLVVIAALAFAWYNGRLVPPSKLHRIPWK